MLFRPKCASCGQTSATIEVIAPQALPAEWASWDERRRLLFNQYRAVESYYLLYEGPAGSNGWVGDPIDAGRANLTIAAFSGVPSGEAMQAAGFYDHASLCPACNVFYCAKHWAITESGFGTCLQGHRKSLDPSWHPEG